jgi:Site-specific recombinase XerD
VGVKVRERKPGEWWIYIDHKGRRKAVKVGSEAAATKAAKKMEEGFAAGAVLPGPKTKVLFRDRYKTWLRHHVGQSCEESTAGTYITIWKNHVEEEFGHLTIDTIDIAMIREFYAKKTEAGYSKNYLRNMRNLISGVMTLAIEDKMADTNPAARTGKYLKSAKAARKAEFLTPEEARLLLDNVRGVFYPFFLTAARTGLRQGELIGLRWGDLDWNGKFLTVRRTIYEKKAKLPKSGKERKVDMSDQLLAVLRDHKKAMTAEALKKGRALSEYVFTSSRNKPHEPSWIRKVHFNALKAAGLRQVPFHALRHSFASALIGNGASLAYVKEQMGHHSIKVTVDTYGHLIPGANRAEVNKLDDAGTRGIRNPAATGANSGCQVGEKTMEIVNSLKQADCA